MRDKLHSVLPLFGFDNNACDIDRFCAEEDGTPYHVWTIRCGDSLYVIKRVSDAEREVYESFFSGECRGVPENYGFRELDGEAFMLMEYVEGETMTCCSRTALKHAIDSIIAIQMKFWNNIELANVGFSFDKSFANKRERLPFMEDLQKAYQAYLDCYQAVPRTLCNDDLLPFNVITNDTRAVIIDWEYGGILPYPCALARLIAFGEDTPDAMFYMTREDQEFAVKYYYDNLVVHVGISWEDYIYTLKLFLFKEYSEWVYCANSSGMTDMPYYKTYYPVAKSLAVELGFAVC